MTSPLSYHLNLHAEATPAAFDYLRDRLYVIRTLIPNGYEGYFIRRARYRSVFTSTAIEGNTLAEQQALYVLVEGANEENPTELEITNLNEAYELVTQIAGDRSVRIDEGLVRTMNSVMQRGLTTPGAPTRGQYRVGPSLIINEMTREIRYRPPPPEWVPDLMRGLVQDIQKWIDEGSYPGPVIAALAHFGLISIHPFVDGNGRTARLLADMILQRTGWSNGGMLSVSEAIRDQQMTYYEVLRHTQGDSYRPEVDVTPFVEFHTDALSIASARLEDLAISFARRREEFRQASADTMNARQALAFLFMMDLAPLSTSMYAELTGASQSSAFSDLNDMIARGYVERVGRGRSTRYRVHPELRRRLEEVAATNDFEASSE